jgi:hypothetical protein
MVFFIVVALGVAGALFLVSERSEITNAGYRLARLESERRKLTEQNRHAEARVAVLKAPARLVDRVKSLHLDLVPPEERLVDPSAKPAKSR